MNPPPIKLRRAGTNFHEFLTTDFADYSDFFSHDSTELVEVRVHREHREIALRRCFANTVNSNQTLSEVNFNRV
jgi:hypothetical protein